MRPLLPALLLFTVAGFTAPGDEVVAIADPAALERALERAAAAAAKNELQIAQSSYRGALLEGWLLLGALDSDKGKLQAASSSFERAASSALETRRARTALAAVQLRLGEVQEAVFLLRGLVGERPSDSVSRQLLARALVAGGQLDEAVQELEELRALAPEDAENLYLLATAYLSQGRLEVAEPLFAELATLRPIPQTRVLIGRTLRDFGHPESARAALRTALKTDPQTRRAHYYLATIDLKDQGLGLLQEAAAHLEAELEIAPDDPMANLYLGIARVEQRRHQEAVPLLETAARSASLKADAFQFLGRSYLALERPAQAVAALRAGLEAAAGRDSEASEDAAAIGPLDVDERRLASLHYQLALALRRLGEEQPARDHFAAAKRHSSRSTESSREILKRYLERDASTLALQPTGFSALVPAWLAELDSGEKEALRGRVSQGLAQSYYNLGVLQMRGERLLRAAALFEQARELAHDFPRLQYSLGVAYFNGGQYERATSPLSLALEADPTDANLRRMLALSFLNSESYSQAARLLRDDDERPGNPSLQYAYALALVRSGRASEAQPVFAALLTEHAEWPELHVVLGQAYAQQGDFPAAITALERAIELHADVADAHATLGDIYLRQGELEKAEQALRKELRLDPENRRSQYVLATVLDLNRKSEQALELLGSLLEQAPDLADGRYLLGKLLLQQGEAAKASAQLEAAAALAPNDANIRYQLGRAYQLLGHSEEAEQQFELYRQLKDRSQGPGR